MLTRATQIFRVYDGGCYVYSLRVLHCSDVYFELMNI